MTSSEVLPFVLGLVCAYIIGSFPSGYIIGRLKKGVDIRDVGSRNMGAMNVFYSVGFKEGLLVLALDIVKGALAVAVARLLGSPILGQLLAGAAAVLGHSYSIFLKFRGGRGGATCIGVLVFLMPLGAPFYLALFLILLGITRFPTLSYSLAFLSFPFVGWLWYHSVAFVIFSVAILIIPGLRYISRIQEIRSKSGSWSHFFKRKSLKERL